MQTKRLKLFLASSFKLLGNSTVVLCAWLLLVLIITSKQYAHHSYNNYLIFKQTFYHALDGLNLYVYYPKEYNDTNHYGPFFSLFIAPFALLPDYLGMLCWQTANTLFLFFAIKQLPLKTTRVNAIYWIITNELFTALLSFQFNMSVAAVVILAYVLINRKQNFWAAFVIALGTFTKIYGIVGLAFFLFVKEKPKFILYCLFWGTVFLTLPMLIFSPQYILQSYGDWYHSLADKQLLNASLTSMQDISVMGIVRRIAGNSNIRDIYFIIPGMVLFCLPYLRFKQYLAPEFKLYYLASALIFLVIFSNSSESPTYIIALTGVAIWFVMQEKPVKPGIVALFVFAMLLTSFSPSDLFPKFVRVEYVRPYSLKALPCVLIWLILTYDLLFKKFNLKTMQTS